MRRLVVTLLCLLLALAGVRAGLTERRGVDVVFALLMACAIATGCAADARARGKPLPSAAGFAIFTMWPIAAPIYFAVTRGGMRGVYLATVIVLGEAVLYFVPFYITIYLAWGEAPL